MLQDKINDIKPYFKSLETYNDALIVVVRFPNRWAVFPSDDGLIKVAPSENAPHEYFYYGDNNKVSLEEIFDFIKNTVNVNKSVEEKAKLLISKIDELKKLFETNSLETLKTLKFDLQTPKKAKPKRKYTKHKKAQPDAKEVAKNESGSTIVEISGNTENKKENTPKVSQSALNKLKIAVEKNAQAS